jgi:hypothetical protein
MAGNTIATATRAEARMTAKQEPAPTSLIFHSQSDSLGQLEISQQEDFDFTGASDIIRR